MYLFFIYLYLLLLTKVVVFAIPKFEASKPTAIACSTEILFNNACISSFALSAALSISINLTGASVPFTVPFPLIIKSFLAFENVATTF